MSKVNIARYRLLYLNIIVFYFSGSQSALNTRLALEGILLCEWYEIVFKWISYLNVLETVYIRQWE